DVLRGLGLVAEPAEELGVVGELRPQHLHGHLAVVDGVIGQPHRGHATVAHDPLQCVIGADQFLEPLFGMVICGVHQFNPPAAWSTARPMGAAKAPPVALLPMPPPFFTSTATATSPAKATYQVCGGVPSAPCSAVPGLEAISAPVYPAVVRSEAFISSVICSAMSWSIPPEESGSWVDSSLRS